MKKFRSHAEAEAYVKNVLSRIFSTTTNVLDVSETHEIPPPVVEGRIYQLGDYRIFLKNATYFPRLPTGFRGN